MSRRLLVVGSGQRVREAALPAIRRAEGIELGGVVSRKSKSIASEGEEHEVRGFDSLTRERLSGVDLVYLVVAKGAVPAVLRRLVELDVSGVELLIETPVLLVRHLGHRPLLEAFRAAWVSEDCTTLPAFDALRECVASGAIGEPRRAVLDRSGYAYHGLAMAKTLLGGGPVRRARQRRLAPDRRERRVELASGREAVVIDPRDYARGHLRLEGSSGALTDEGSDGDELSLAAELRGSDCIAFRAGDARRELDPAEVELMGQAGPGEGLFRWMDGMKRVGFLALLRRLAAGGGAYPLGEAIEDAVVDYHLEKLGRYRATPLTRPDAALARLGYSLLTRVGDRLRP